MFLQDIEFTNAQVAKALAEAEKERLEFEKTRRQVEQVLSQLQVVEYLLLHSHETLHAGRREKVQPAPAC